MSASITTSHHRSRLVSFDYFRGIAILFIVAGHCYGPWVIDSFGERVLANVITGGTSLFVFISGFFFHHVYYDKFHYRGFLKKKASYVLTPYVILSLMGIAYYTSSSSQLPFADVLGVAELHSWSGRIEMVGMYLWTGKTAVTYWYVPFILIIFAASPFFVRYVGLSPKSRNIIFLALLAVSTLIHRPANNLSPVHSSLYFTPVYMLGIICSIHRDSVMEFIKGKSIVIGLAVLFLSVIQILLYEGYGNFHKEEMFSYGGLDIIIFQKIALCFFFLSIFQKLESRDVPALKLLASSSFALFFIHPWILEAISETGVRSFVDVPGMAMFVMTVPLVLISSLLIAYAVKLVLKKNSRYVTGW